MNGFWEAVNAIGNLLIGIGSILAGIVGAIALFRHHDDE